MNLQSDPLEFDFMAPEQTGTLHSKKAPLTDQLAAFNEFNQETRILETKFHSATDGNLTVPTFVNEFWTARQRQAHSLHEISYRACFKPQVPRFFIDRLTKPGDIVHDPFMGRGTTILESALLDRVPYGCDVNPLSIVLARPRLCPPTIDEIARRLGEIDFSKATEAPDDLLVFYHPETLSEISALKSYLIDRNTSGKLDEIDEWIRLVAINRLTGHSPGFFSVYTLPPNQAVSVKSQIRINERRNQTPPRRVVPDIILKKSRSLLRGCTQENREHLKTMSKRAVLLTGAAEEKSRIKSNAVSLVVTSPPFLDIVQYATDNWLRCWFLGIDADGVKLTVPRKLDTWMEAMRKVFTELRRILKPGGHIAFEVGEVKKGKIRLEEAVLQCGHAVGLEPLSVVINDQEFTKTANCWGVDNNSKGTNTNRIVVFQNPTA